MTSDDPQQWLAAANEARRRGRPDLAQRALLRAARLGGDARRICAILVDARGSRSVATALSELGGSAAVPAELRIEAARQLQQLGYALEAVEVARSLLDSEPGHLEALRLHAALAARLGWVHDAQHSLRRLIDLTDNSADALLALAIHYGTFGDHERACTAALGARNGDSRGEADLVLARQTAQAGGLEEAARWCRSARAHVVGDLDRMRELATIAVRSACPSDAEPILAEVLRHYPEDADAIATLAQIHLFRSDLSRAHELARVALAHHPEHPTALAVSTGVSVLAGDYDRALRTGSTSPTHDSSYFHFRGEALRRLGRFHEAVPEFDRAISVAGRYALSADAHRLLTILEGEAAGVLPLGKTHDYDEILGALEPITGAPPAMRDRATMIEHLGQAIQALGGNRTEYPTTLVDGQLVGMPVRVNARNAARLQQGLLRTRSPDDVLSSFDALRRQYGDKATICCHEGEVLLWLGQYARAESCFLRAGELDGQTRWAWLGLAAAKMFLGDLDSASLAFDRLADIGLASKGSVWVYRGELALRQGALEQAQADLDLAVAANPERIAARLLRARLHARLGEDMAAQDLFAKIRLQAPDLVAEVAAAGSESLPVTMDRMLEMMRGNRSSALPAYMGPKGRLRFIMREGAR